MEALFHQIANIGREYGAAKVVLYGSRARGDNRERSDIDLAVYGVAAEKQPLFREALEQLPTLLDFDVVFVSARTDAALLANIQKDGVTLMRKFEEKYEKFSEAVKRLEEAVQDYEKTPISTVRDGVIQRFEFCTELAWKSTREYLIEQGYTELNSPKAVMRQAYADGLIADETVWLRLLDARNLTSHIYDEQTASDIFEDVCKRYLPQFHDLLRKLGK